MKSTGMTRRIDELGRIVLPAEIRQTMGIEVRDRLEIYTEGDTIILRKYLPSCIFCTSAEELTDFDGKPICRRCLRRLGALDRER